MHIERKWARSEIRTFANSAQNAASRAAEERLSPIVAFSKSFGLDLHSNVIRDNGKPYSAHLLEVAIKVGDLIISKTYVDAAVAAAWLHDSHEDIWGVVIKNPFTYMAAQYTLQLFKKKPKKLVINDELVAFGEQGAMASFMIYVLTRDERVHGAKFNYMMNMFNAMRRAQSPEIKAQYPDLESWLKVSLVIKAVDRNANTDPGETYDYSRDLENARKANEKGRQDIIDFLTKLKVSDKFYDDHGKFTGFDEAHFLTALKEKFDGKKKYFAMDNLDLYLPMLEWWLLIEPGLEGKKKNRVNEDKARSEVTIYDYTGARNLLKSAYEKSIDIVSPMEWPERTPIYFAKTAGAAGIVTIYEGYTSLVEEIRLEREMHKRERGPNAPSQPQE